MTADPWADRGYLRGRQYRTDANLAARQSVYAYQHPRIHLAARVLDLAAAAGSVPGIVLDVGCGNGAYLAELARRGFGGRVLGADLSLGMLAAARERVAAAARAPVAQGTATAGAGATEPVAPGTAAPVAPGTAAPVAPGTAAPVAPGTPAPVAPGTAAPVAPGTPAPVAVALAAADAAALPLRDGAVGLVLAPHMLYHLPDPAAGLRELRRVTRPGGRLVVVLNGAGHLRQLRAAVAAAYGGDPAALGEPVTLDDGESLARACFDRVTRHDFPAELRIPSAGPVVDYIRSMAGTGRLGEPGDEGGRHADTDRIAAESVAAFPRDLNGHYIITSHAGCLICE